MGLSPVLAGSAFAQMSTEEVDTPSSPQKPQRTIVANSQRTSNQINQPRKYVAGRKRFSIYWPWSYPWEANRDVAELANRLSTTTEVRRAAWPRYENPERSERALLIGIAGSL